MTRTVVCVCLIAFSAGLIPGMVAADELSYTREQDVIHGRKFGVALTMDVVTPKRGVNGVGVIWNDLAPDLPIAEWTDSLPFMAFHHLRGVETALLG